jgi:hypothetical protein
MLRRRKAPSRSTRASGDFSRKQRLPAPGKFAVLVFNHERPELQDGVVDILVADESFDRDLLGREAFAQILFLHVENARYIDVAVGVAHELFAFIDPFGVDQIYCDRQRSRRAARGRSSIWSPDSSSCDTARDVSAITKQRNLKGG